jgi:hypothetical protein
LLQQQIQMVIDLLAWKDSDCTSRIIGMAQPDATFFNERRKTMEIRVFFGAEKIIFKQ